MIIRDAVYTLTEFKERTGFKPAGMQKARQAGLKCYYVHTRCFILGSDFIEYLEAKGKLHAPKGRKKAKRGRQ